MWLEEDRNDIELASFKGSDGTEQAVTLITEKAGIEVSVVNGECAPDYYTYTLVKQPDRDAQGCYKLVIAVKAGKQFGRVKGEAVLEVKGPTPQRASAFPCAQRDLLTVPIVSVARPRFCSRVCPARATGWGRSARRDERAPRTPHEPIRPPTICRGSDSTRRSGGRPAMTVPYPSARSRGTSPRRLLGFFGLSAALLATACVAAAPAVSTDRTAPVADSPPTPDVRLAAFDQPPVASEPPAAKPKETLVGGFPLFNDWPKGQKPDAVIVLSGQTFGYLQPCGCSRPQIGGLERAVFIESLRAKGWPVAGVDLGDLYPETGRPRGAGETLQVRCDDERACATWGTSRWGSGKRRSEGRT